ncbi:MAG TPA: hypothetical protein DEO44_05235 [Verrucomicrobia subdivision 6 bacterium]|uniref:Uncharacterized protein n=2 Tax=Verrucomicrobia subdivision 6 TaxID=134627 RepID=A0A0R2RRT2_9BACT|nr:MAG: hypothetical protein ABR82_03935 [Verrucomicrobia subdivision 6 bacterium BACL9 MAG-120507-bin52]KRP33136.1 MAG: hypothetical protein ABS33_05170 [Verrucomicrobia subdivision 6 bacterium BACL9 MAG-120924-bin69]HBZ85121.1 hypothetical protein [Verrucomicrobia subdivision 6 bacterium]HCP06046.1 hypothetical protein [Verrucomicrobiales bacterium]
MGARGGLGKRGGNLRGEGKGGLDGWKNPRGWGFLKLRGGRGRFVPPPAKRLEQITNFIEWIPRGWVWRAGILGRGGRN